REHRGTLQFVSAWIGDGVLLPIMNVAGDDLLRRTGGAPTTAEGIGAVIVGGLVTTVMHVIQGARGLVNWSMPRPWRWNLLGWYHVVFMWAQLALLASYAIRAIRRARSLTVGDWTRVGAIGVGLAVFAAILQFDYRDDR
ncbi:MAG: hypothetical protein NZ518_02995, partial [Dehalococcoidia bacterium]|nr:hypothetical protein [Dehalococcoidia bacterium]